jgi:uncharacterized protein GlcG (DUF336 family)
MFMNKTTQRWIVRAGLALAAVAALSGTAAVSADTATGCRGLPSFEHLRATLRQVVAGNNGGSGAPMWGAIVNRNGEVCAVAYSGAQRGDQFPGSRTIAAAKANTSNMFSLQDAPLATGALYAGVQPGGPLFGLDQGNPVDASVAYAGSADAFGTANDPLIGKKIGGTIVFGGGLPLYDARGTLLGAIGVSGDTACADHVIAWRARDALRLDFLPNGPTGDNIVIGAGGHPECTPAAADLVASLPVKSPIGRR